MTSKEIKEIDSPEELHQLIKNRWSPRSFSDKIISEPQMQILLEAARWAPSGSNLQPWHYTYAMRGTEGFNTLFECLTGGNRAWTNKAGVLLVAFAKKEDPETGQKFGTAEHDLGLANMQLVTQALSQDIYAHMMAGFDAQKLKESISYEDHLKPICMMAIGYLGDADLLVEPFKSRELTPRDRNELSSFTNLLP